jgi:hypothetical protein
MTWVINIIFIARVKTINIVISAGTAAKYNI